MISGAGSVLIGRIYVGVHWILLLTKNISCGPHDYRENLEVCSVIGLCKLYVAMATRAKDHALKISCYIGSAPATIVYPHVSLNLLNNLRKIDKKRGFSSIYHIFTKSFNQLNATGE